MISKREVLKEITKALRVNNNFLITTHLHPDGDGIGSELVLRELLEQKGKKAVILNDTPAPHLYRFLPGSENISTKLQRDFKPQVVIALDTPTLDRLGRIKEYVINTPFIINIDHHISNVCFGNINWVNPGASSVAEQVIKILQYLKMEISSRWAVCLYTAILTDTGSFRYMNTTAYTHRIAAMLIKKGVRPEEIARFIYESNSLEKVYSIGRILKTLKTTPGGEVAWVTIPQSERYENDEEIVTYPRSIRSVKVAILFRQLKESRIKISFRSKGGIDVNALAQKFGGGGHPAASGCVVKGSLSQVRKKILKETVSYLR